MKKQKIKRVSDETYLTNPILTLKDASFVKSEKNGFAFIKTQIPALLSKLKLFFPDEKFELIDVK